MTRTDILAAIRSILTDHMGNAHMARFSESARLNEDLYLDSVLVLQIFLNLELEFALAAPEEAIAASDISTVADIIDILDPALAGAAPSNAEPAEPETEPSLGVHGDDYVDLKIHCFVSCVCAALKAANIDHRPFYFGVWDADFAVTARHELNYHAPTVSHDFFRQWYRRLYGVTLREWYDPALSKDENIAVLLALLEARTDTQHVMVMLDMFHLPERENKFNQNPFPHYLMLELSEDPDIWEVRDPDFRWEGRIARETVLNAIRQPSVAGGYIFDRREAKEPTPEDLKAYFEACFIADANPLTQATKRIVEAHVAGYDGLTLSDLTFALRELPVISIRKWAYEHGFAFFWRALKAPDAEFQSWCDEIEKLALGFKTLHYSIMKLSQTGDASFAPAVLDSLDDLHRLELRIKERLARAFADWCAQEGLGVEAPALARRAVG